MNNSKIHFVGNDTIEEIENYETIENCVESILEPKTKNFKK